MQSLFSNGDLSFGDLSGSLSLLSDINLLLGGPEFNVTLRWKIRTDSTVGSVCSSSSLGGSVGLHVLNGQVLKVLGIGIGFQVLDQAQHNLDWLFGPSSGGLAELAGLSGSTDSTVIFGVRNTSLLGKNIVQVSLGIGNGESSDGLCGFVSVLVVHSHILSWGSCD